MRNTPLSADRHVDVSLVCPNTLAREGLRRILDEEGFCVSLSAASFDTLAETLEDEASELIIVDSDSISCDSRQFMDFCSAHPDSRLVILVSKFDLEEMLNAFRGGACGYIIKEIGCASLVSSLKLVMLGEKIMPSELIQHLPQYLVEKPIAPSTKSELAQSLSERERETLRCLVLGHANKVIARRLDISEATVKVHVKAILRKLAVQNRTQAAIWAVNNGIVPQQMDAYETHDHAPMPEKNALEQVAEFNS